MAPTVCTASSSSPTSQSISSTSHLSNADCLEFDVVPERCLRNDSVEFNIGTPINQVLTMIQQNARILHHVDLLYSKKEPFGRDISVHLHCGVRLVFDAVSQLLKYMEVDDLSHIVLKYNGQIFSEPGAEATMDRVEECFGSTHPGAYDESERVYVQSWRGLCFYFPTANSAHVEVTPGFNKQLRSLKYDSISAPTLTKMTIFKGAHPTDMHTEQLETPLLTYCGQNRLLLAESVADENGTITGVEFTYVTEDKTKTATRSAHHEFDLVTMKKLVSFGDRVPEVMAALGAPSKVFYKSDDKMSIHKGGSKETVETQPHFFFNYFSMGCDILFDFTTKRVCKFVFHNNIPGHYHFGTYARCNFRVECGSGATTVLTTTSKYDDFSRILLNTQPVVITRPCSEERNPFGPTYAYGTRQVVVEVMENFHISGLTIFQAQ